MEHLTLGLLVHSGIQPAVLPGVPTNTRPPPQPSLPRHVSPQNLQSSKSKSSEHVTQSAPEIGIPDILDDPDSPQSRDPEVNEKLIMRTASYMPHASSLEKDGAGPQPTLAYTCVYRGIDSNEELVVYSKGSSDVQPKPTPSGRLGAPGALQVSGISFLPHDFQV